MGATDAQSIAPPARHIQSCPREDDIAKLQQDLRDRRARTRAAHLRWVRGDLPGAIELMNSAVKSARLRDRESVA